MRHLQHAKHAEEMTITELKWDTVLQRDSAISHHVKWIFISQLFKSTHLSSLLVNSKHPIKFHYTSNCSGERILSSPFMLTVCHMAVSQHFWFNKDMHWVIFLHFKVSLFFFPKALMMIWLSNGYILTKLSNF